MTRKVSENKLSLKNQCAIKKLGFKKENNIK
jgi:hypothetical protein